MHTDESGQLLKRDLFGEVRLLCDSDGCRIRRDTRTSSWWLQPVARRLAGREASALERLSAQPDIPSLHHWDGHVLDREWLSGEPMHRGRPMQPGYYRDALRILRIMHRQGIVHNDTAKEPNWLVRPDGKPALIDFQIAMRFTRRGKLFRMLAREDIRHLLKHKRTYLPQSLSPRQLKMLASPAVSARAWRKSVKPVYRWITRGLLGWRDNEGANDRGSV